MQKKAYPIGKPDFPKEKQKTLQCFLFQNGGYRTPKPGLRLEKSVKKVEKSSFIQKIDIRFHHLQLYLWE